MTERPIPFKPDMVRAILAGTKTQTRRIVATANSRFGSANRRYWPHADFARASVDGRGTGSEYLHVPAHVGPCGDCDHWGWSETSHRLYAHVAPAGVWDEAPSPGYTPPATRLWVREHYYVAEVAGQGSGNGFVIFDDEWTDQEPAPRELRPITGRQFGSHAAFHLPRWASRILLDVVAVRVERLQDISEADAKAEGVQTRAELYPDQPMHADEPPSAYSHRDQFRQLWDSINGKRPGCDWASGPWVWVVAFRRAESTEARATA